MVIILLFFMFCTSYLRGDIIALSIEMIKRYDNGIISRSIKIIYDGRFNGYEFYEELNYTIYYSIHGMFLMIYQKQNQN